jgi:spore coat protein JB
MNEKHTLLRDLSAVGFCMIDLQLYLDTHPTDASALSLYNQYHQKHMALMTEYERKYGPLMAHNGASSNYWLWIKDPWPWEYEANVEVR